MGDGLKSGVGGAGTTLEIKYSGKTKDDNL